MHFNIWLPSLALRMPPPHSPSPSRPPPSTCYLHLCSGAGVAGKPITRRRSVKEHFSLLLSVYIPWASKLKKHMWCCEHNLKCHWKWLRWIPLKMSTFLFTSKKAMKPAPDVFWIKSKRAVFASDPDHIGHYKHRASKPPQRTILENCAKGNVDINIDTRQTNYYSWSQGVVSILIF